MLTFISFLRSKIIEVVAVVGLALLALGQLRGSIRKDAQSEVIREMEKTDEDRAADIRHRVDGVRPRVRPDATDTRGYRD